MRGLILYIWMCYTCLSAFSQTGKYIPFGSSLIYPENGSLATKTTLGSRLDAFRNAYVATGFDGKVRFIKSSTLTDARGNQIYKPEMRILENLNTGFELKPNVYLQFTAKEPKCVGCDRRKTELIKREIHYNPEDESITIAREESIYTGEIMELDIIPDTLGGHWVFIRNYRSWSKIFYFNTETYPLRTKEMDLLRSKIGSLVASSHNGHLGGVVSPSGNYLVINNVSTIWHPSEDEALDKYRWKLDLYVLDKANGNLSFHSNIIDTTTVGKHYVRTPFQVTSDDKYVYFSKEFRETSSLRHDLLDLKLQRYDINSQKLETLFDLKSLAESENNQYPIGPSDIRILDKDKFILRRGSLSGSRDSTFILDFLKKPNSASPEYEPNAFTSMIEWSNQHLSFGRSPYNYIRITPQYTYDCAGHVSFEDQSDYGLPKTAVQYYVEEVAGSGVLIPKGENPRITYTEDGDYLCKVVLKSHEGNYKEIHYDTLKIRIPEKPVADFAAADTVICAYSTLEFTNHSTTDTIHTTNGEKWVWSFGDGETQIYNTPPPWGGAGGGAEHVYTRPGTYTVSLFYSNGFCDSTLTKNQYITVVDAPSPGFSIDNNRGCSPFTVNITDTITRNTVKKEIIYGDGTVDTFYANSLPPWGRAGVGAVPHEYTTPGNYWITQRLYGYTGCITQLDSVRIYVTPGFTELDTSHITTATYQDVPAHPKVAEIITVNWQCLLEEAPVSYHLYRNNQKIAELDPQPCIYGQIVYLDSLEQASNSLLTYTIRVIDSCGTAAQVGRVGQPVRVSGEVVGNNELSIVSYTTYQNWKVGESELHYELQTEDVSGQWQTIHDQTGNTPYSDYDFLDTKKEGLQLDKCYRVIAKGTNQTSISNILCLPYTPVIFLPTAFTPNGDNLNDVYRPVTFGIEHYEVDIYNTYGQKLIHFTETDSGWAAADIAMGAYLVIIRAKGTDNEWYNLKQTVTVVR